MPSVPPVIGGGTATPDGAGQSSTVFQPPVTTPQGVQKSEPEALVYHWFYLHRDNKDVIDTMTHFDDVVSHDSNRQRTPPSQSANTVNQEEVWKPFSMIDNVAIEDGLESGDELTPVPVDGGRYDVSIKDRTKNSVFWKEDYPCPIRRCSWFYQSNVTGRWVPYSEPLAQEFEAEYNAGFASGSWSRKLELEEPGEYVMFHSSTVMLHFPKTSHSKLDDWGQVQPPADPMMKPRVMHRGLEGLPEIPDGDVPGQFDHLVFVVHGIGAACDMKFQSVVGATTTMRQMVNEMSERHFSYAHMAGKASRIEFLPVNWHATLHGEDTGTDQRMKALTLRSIPKLRGFVNDTILDVLFYTSPVYCQRIIDTVISEINRMYTLFMARNEDFSGEVSMAGHSLGSLILFDILCNQDPTGCSGQSGPVSSSTEGGGAATIAGQVIETITGGPADHNLAADPSIQTVEHLFDKLCIGREHLASFDGIDLEALMTSRSEDLKEAGLPEEANKAIMKFIQQRKTAKPDDKVDGLEAYQKASVTSDIKYTIGPAGTGQPSVKYQQLLFKVSAFYALGSPIGCFMAVRGLDYLGPSFKFPTCRRFFNIFHPYDAIAFRFEALIDKEYGTKLKPVTIPHHKGRKRMHLELKDTVTKLMTSDFKQKLINSAWAALGSVYNTVTGSTDQAAAAALEESMEKTAAKEEEEDANNPTKINSELNEGNRIDYALQEAPFETFNEYVFALSSHLCYWESEDTFLFMLKDIYGQMDVLPDDQVAGMAGGQDTFGGGSASVPTFVESPTPTLINNSLQQRPSATPTLVNNQLQTSSTPTLVNNQLQTSSTPTLVNNQLQTSTPTLVNNQLQSPTPTLVNNQLQSPTPTLVNNQLKTTPTPTLVNSQLQPTATTGSQPPQQQTLTNVPLSPPSTSEFTCQVVSDLHP